MHGYRITKFLDPACCIFRHMVVWLPAHYTIRGSSPLVMLMTPWISMLNILRPDPFLRDRGTSRKMCTRKMSSHEKTKLLAVYSC